MSHATEAVTMPLIEIVVDGPLNAAAVPRVRRLLDDAVSLRPAHLVVDLTAAEFLDAAGIGLLLDVHRHCHTAGGRLTLRGLSPRSSRVLRITRLDRVLHITGTPAGPDPQPIGGSPR